MSNGRVVTFMSARMRSRHPPRTGVLAPTSVSPSATAAREALRGTIVGLTLAAAALRRSPDAVKSLTNLRDAMSDVDRGKFDKALASLLTAANALVGSASGFNLAGESVVDAVLTSASILAPGANRTVVHSKAPFWPF